jgi:hypothetical protein
MLAIRSPLAFWFVLATLLMAPPATFAWQAENPNSPFTPLGLPGLPGAAAENPLSLTAEYQVAADRSSGWITVRGAIQPGWKVYSTTQKAGGPLPSKLRTMSSWHARSSPAGLRKSNRRMRISRSHQKNIPWMSSGPHRCGFRPEPTPKP